MLELELASLYERHAADVFRYALYLSGERAEAEDIVSETFLRVWTARDRVDLGTVRAYLLTIARNLFLHERRRAGRRSEMPATLPDPAPGPAAAAEGRAEMAAVMEALQSLPEVDRSALLLRAQEDMPYEEIGAVLGITSTAARVKVHRARLRMAAARHPRENRS